MKYTWADYFFLGMFVGLLLIVTVFCVLVGGAWAQDLAIVHIEPRTGAPGITRNEANQLVAELKKRYEYESRKYLRIVYFLSMAEMSTHLTLADRQLRLQDYKRYGHNAIGKRARILFIVPPVEENGELWITGVANGGCSREGVAYAAATRTNAHGESRKTESLQAAMHEIGHLFGATHDQGIMDSNIAAIHSAVTFSSKTIGQFLNCKN